MKAIGLLLTFMFVGSACAANSYPVAETTQPAVSYMCTQYTQNQVFDDRSTTDNPPVQGDTEVKQTVMGFDIAAGKVFPQEKILTNSQMGSTSGMAGDPETLLLKKEDDSGFPYFIIYQFDKTKVSKDGKVKKDAKGAIIGMVVLGNCTI